MLGSVGTVHFKIYLIHYKIIEYISQDIVHISLYIVYITRFIPRLIITTSDFLIYERKNVLKIIHVDFFCSKMLHISSFSSSNFEFLNMHISLDNFSCHMCDVIGVNRSMKREYVKALDQLSSPITNR